MRALRQRRFLSGISLLPLLLLLACEREAPEPATREVDVGVHRVRFVVPVGWLHVDHGREQRLQRGSAQVVLADLGPVTPRGFADRLVEARMLFRRGQWEDARTLLVWMDLRSLFPSEARWRSIQEDWKRVTRIRRRDEPGDEPADAVDPDVAQEVESSFSALLFEIEVMPRRDLETLALQALEKLGHDSMRSIAGTEAVAVSGRPAIRIETWDRLSHRTRRSHLFVENEGHLLGLRMAFGSDVELESAFEALAESLTLPTDQGSDAGDESEAPDAESGGV
jgi:hypothetical protein